MISLRSQEQNHHDARIRLGYNLLYCPTQQRQRWQKGCSNSSIRAEIPRYLGAIFHLHLSAVAYSSGATIIKPRGRSVGTIMKSNDLHVFPSCCGESPRWWWRLVFTWHVCVGKCGGAHLYSAQFYSTDDKHLRNLIYHTENYDMPLYFQSFLVVVVAFVVFGAGNSSRRRPTACQTAPKENHHHHHQVAASAFCLWWVLLCSGNVLGNRRPLRLGRLRLWENSRLQLGQTGMYGILGPRGESVRW